MKSLLSLLLFSFLPQTLWAWGGRGHHVICHAAVFLVKEEGLKKYLMARPQVMGHLCNIPDTYWRGLGSEANRLGSPSHFIDVEITGRPIQDIPLDFQELAKSFEGQPNAVEKTKKIISFPEEFGSLWWRADQFYRLASQPALDLKKYPPPANSQQEQDEKLPFNKFIADFVTHIGLLGHFVGDASQPLHATFDYDGYLAGHGGIHSYYEELAVVAIGEKLEEKVLIKARAFQRIKPQFLKEDSVLKQMRTLSAVSHSEIPALLKIDPVLKKSENKEEKGMKIKTSAVRADVETVKSKYEPMIVQQLARSAVLLASLWDKAYSEIGKPPLGVYKSYYYPHTPAFVAPDYLPSAPAKSAQ